MTHGDAIMIISSKTTTTAAKLQALDVIINDEHKCDYMCIRQPVMWDLLKTVYKKLKAKENESN